MAFVQHVQIELVPGGYFMALPRSVGMTEEEAVRNHGRSTNCQAGVAREIFDFAMQLRAREPANMLPV